MAELFSQYSSGVQFTAGTITGSANGTSGLNPIVDRLNSISTADNLVTGSVISGTDTNVTVGDHAGSYVPMCSNVVYGTGSPPTASNTTEGTIFFQYIA